MCVFFTIFRYEPWVSRAHESKLKVTITTLADKSESIKTKEPSFITQETKKKIVQLFEEPVKMNSEPIKYDEKSVQPDKKLIQSDMEQIKADMLSTKPQVHTDYAFKFEKEDEDDVYDIDDEKLEVKSVYTEDPDSKTFKYVLNELVDYRVSIRADFFVDNLVQCSCLQTNCMFLVEDWY